MRRDSVKGEKNPYLRSLSTVCKKFSSQVGEGPIYKKIFPRKGEARAFCIFFPTPKKIQGYRTGGKGGTKRVRHKVDSTKI